MNKTSKIIVTTLISLGLILSSCKKGDIGPQGTQGATGPQGTQGPSATKKQFVEVFTSATTSFNYALTLNSTDYVLLYVIDGNGNKNLLPYTGIISSSTMDYFNLIYSTSSSGIYIQNKSSITYANLLNFEAVIIH